MQALNNYLHFLRNLVGSERKIEKEDGERPEAKGDVDVCMAYL